MKISITTVHFFFFLSKTLFYANVGTRNNITFMTAKIDNGYLNAKF